MNSIPWTKYESEQFAVGRRNGKFVLVRVHSRSSSWMSWVARTSFK